MFVTSEHRASWPRAVRPVLGTVSRAVRPVLGTEFVVSSDDLRELYYTYRVSDKRARRLKICCPTPKPAVYLGHPAA